MALLTFGTDGWRGIIGEDFTFANVRRAADALSRVLPPRSLVAVGHDWRFLSESFAREAAAVLAAGGHRVVLLSQATTTPALSFTVKTLRARAGVMITASHNPPLYNGFKVKVPPGCSADPEFTRLLEEALSNEVPSAPKEFKFKSFSPDESYVAFLASKMDRKFWRGGRLSLAADGMHGCGGLLWSKVLAKLGVKAPVVRSRRDPLFGGCSPEPIEKNLGPLSEAVLKGRAALGLAVDGDGDRLGAVDDKGLYVPPHEVFPLILLHLLEDRRMKGGVVQAVSLGALSEAIARKFGLDFTEVPVGFKHVSEQMRRGRVLLGGEESGGYGVGLWSLERDGLLMGLLLAEMVLARKMPLSALRKDLADRFGPSFFRREDMPLKAPIADRAHWAEALSKKAPERLAEMKVREVRTLDGLKMLLEDGSWLLLRPSGTEPLLRAYAESGSLEKTKRLLVKAQEIATMRLS